MCHEFKCFAKNRVKKTNFILFVDTYMTFQVIFMQCKGSKDVNLMDFSVAGYVYSQS